MRYRAQESPEHGNDADRDGNGNGAGVLKQSGAFVGYEILDFGEQILEKQKLRHRNSDGLTFGLTYQH